MPFEGQPACSGEIRDLGQDLAHAADFSWLHVRCHRFQQLGCDPHRARAVFADAAGIRGRKYAEKCRQNDGDPVP